MPSPAAWLIVSDDVAQAVSYSRLIASTTRTSQTVYVPPQGFATYSFLAMRHVDGIVQSAMRAWSSFSAVPSLMAGVPIFSVEPGRWGVLPHSRICSTVEQYAPCPCLPGWLGDETKFVARVARGSLACVDPPPTRLRRAAEQGALSRDFYRWMTG